MNMNFAPTFHPFDPADRPGGLAGGTATHLSPTDLAGVISPTRKLRGGGASTKVSGNAKTGLAAIDAKAAAAPVDQHKGLETYAKQLVSQTFFGTMLKQMRESPFKSDLFEGGRGGQAFTGMYDQKMADQMSRGAGKRLVNAIVRKLEANKAYAKQGTAAVGAAAPVTALTPANLPAGLHYAKAKAAAGAAGTAGPTGATPVDNHSNRNARPHDVPHVRA
jgi:Rod binding domain-containing protein